MEPPEVPPSIAASAAPASAPITQGSSPPQHDHDHDPNDQSGRPSKRQKFSNNARGGFKSRQVSGHNKKNPMVELRRGLEFLISSQAYSEKALQHAGDLYNLLFDPAAGTSALLPEYDGHGDAPTSQLDQAQDAETTIKEEDSKISGEEPKNPHTDVPPPFAMPKAKTFAQGTSPSLHNLNQKAPAKSSFGPVPPMLNSATTNLVKAPSSTALPQAPHISDISLCNAPFMHTSALPAYVSPTGTNSYEHLEFLGDAYLEVIATRLIHARFPLHTVGQKAGLRELLVKNETLAEYTRAYGWGERIQCLEQNRQGSAWTKILADVFEAYLACVIIQDLTDAGFLAAEVWLTELWAPKILEWRRNGDGLHDTSRKVDQPLDAKTDLNKLLVGKESKLDYREEKAMQLIKEGNRTVFFMGVYLTGWGYQNQHLGSGEGRSKQIAGTKAAEDALFRSADIIREAHQRKSTFERQFKTVKAKKSFQPRGGFGGQQSFGQGAPAYAQPGPPPAYGQAAPPQGMPPAYGQPPPNYGQPPAHYGGYQ